MTDVRAIVLLTEDPSSPQEFASIHIPHLHVLGKPVFAHMADRLARSGVDKLTLLTSDPLDDYQRPPGVRVLNVETAQAWEAARDVFIEYTKAGAQQVFVMRMGAYAEFDLRYILQFHEANKNAVTRVCDAQGFCLDAGMLDTWQQPDAHFALRNQFSTTRQFSRDYWFTGYINYLRSPRDLRRLAQDALMQECSIVPEGEQLRPGVWAGKGARIDRSARIVAPAFVGAQSRVGSNVVITRSSSIENGSEVDANSLVEDSTVLQHTYLGSGLDLTHSVLGFSKIAQVRRNVTVPIHDSRLTRTLPTSETIRRITGAASAIRDLPSKIRAKSAVVSIQDAEPQIVTPEEAPTPRALPAKRKAASR